MSIYIADTNDLFVQSLQNYQPSLEELLEQAEPFEDNIARGDAHPLWGSHINKGRALSEEHKQKISEARNGARHTEESKAKTSQSMKGKANKKGYKLTPEQREKIAAGRRGKKFPRA